jgi:hypothetical protein
MDSTLLQQPEFLQAAQKAWGTNSKDQPAGEFWLSYAQTYKSDETGTKEAAEPNLYSC